MGKEKSVVILFFVVVSACTIVSWHKNSLLLYQIPLALVILILLYGIAKNVAYAFKVEKHLVKGIIEDFEIKMETVNDKSTNFNIKVKLLDREETVTVKTYKFRKPQIGKEIILAPDMFTDDYILYNKLTKANAIGNIIVLALMTLYLAKELFF